MRWVERLRVGRVAIAVCIGVVGGGVASYWVTTETTVSWIPRLAALGGDEGLVGGAVWVVRAALIALSAIVEAGSGVLGFGHDFKIVLIHIDFPDPDGVVGAAGRQELDVRGQQ